jgi:hypothetical protein
MPRKSAGGQLVAPRFSQSSQSASQHPTTTTFSSVNPIRKFLNNSSLKNTLSSGADDNISFREIIPLHILNHRSDLSNKNSSNPLRSRADFLVSIYHLIFPKPIMEDLNINSAAAETKRASESTRPFRTISAPAAPVEYDLTQESLNTLNMASESSGPCAPSRRSVSRVEHTEHIGGVPMKRSYARIGNSGGRPCSGPSIVASTQTPQDPLTVRSPVVPNPGTNQTIGQSGNSQRPIRGEATVRGGGHPSQGNGANPGEVRCKNYHVHPSNPSNSNGT